MTHRFRTALRILNPVAGLCCRGSGLGVERISKDPVQDHIGHVQAKPYKSDTSRDHERDAKGREQKCGRKHDEPALFGVFFLVLFQYLDKNRAS